MAPPGTASVRFPKGPLTAALKARTSYEARSTTAFAALGAWCSAQDGRVVDGPWVLPLIENSDYTAGQDPFALAAVKMAPG